MAELIDRPGLKAQTKSLLRDAQVSPKAFVMLYLVINLALSIADSLAIGDASPMALNNPLGVFVSILTSLLSRVLAVGFVLYCMAVRRGERAEFLTLFDGFSFAGKIVGLAIVESFFIMLWSMLFVIPGFVAAYRYRFAFYNLCENPDMGCMDALNMSKKQTLGYKGQLFMLDMSYIGWQILGSLPLMVFSGMESYALVSSICGAAVSGPAIPTMVQTLVVGLWSLVVALFYLPTYQCTELGYFEIAQRTSGVTPLGPSLPLHQDETDNGNGGLF